VSEHGSLTRADAFNDALRTGTTSDPETAALLTIATQLRRVVGAAEVRPDPQFRADLRKRLLAAAAAENSDGTPRPAAAAGRGTGRRGRLPDVPFRVALYAAAALAVIALAGGALLSRYTGSSAPATPTTSAARTTAELAPAQACADQVLRDVQQDPGKVPATLAMLDQQVRSGAAAVTSGAVERGDRASLDTLARWAAQERARLAQVEAAARPQDRPRVQQSRALLGRVEQRARALAPLLGCPCMNNPVKDDLGPVPCVDCADPSSPPALEGPPTVSGSGVGTASEPTEVGTESVPTVEPPAKTADPEPSLEPEPEPTLIAPVPVVSTVPSSDEVLPPVPVETTPAVEAPTPPAVTVDLPLIPGIPVGGDAGGLPGL
jgi:hypothetical protein